MLMHVADPAAQITVIENISRSREKVVVTNVGDLREDLQVNKIKGPAILLFGISARGAWRMTTGGQATQGLFKKRSVARK